MVRFIAFDEETANVVAERFQMPVDHRPGTDAFDSALQSLSSTTLLLLPGAGGNEVLVAKIQRNLPAAVTESQKTMSYQATGFLGLIDEPVYEPDTPKKWWQRILD